jgi:hypothetical protein
VPLSDGDANVEPQQVRGDLCKREVTPFVFSIEVGLVRIHAATSVDDAVDSADGAEIACCGQLGGIGEPRLVEFERCSDVRSYPIDRSTHGGDGQVCNVGEKFVLRRAGTGTPAKARQRR